MVIISVQEMGKDWKGDGKSAQRRPRGSCLDAAGRPVDRVKATGSLDQSCCWVEQYRPNLIRFNSPTGRRTEDSE